VIWLVLGRRQLGKTTLAYSMALKCANRIILDPRGLIRGTGGVRVGQRAQFDQAIEMLHAKELREIIVTPEGDLDRMFSATAVAVKAWNRDHATSARDDKRLMWLIDEARFFDKSLAKSEAFKFLLRASERDLVHIVLTAHRPADIPTDVRAISDHWIMFRTTQEHDLKVIDDRCGPKVRDLVANLNPHEFVQWDDAGGTVRAFREPARWFVALDQGHGQAQLGPDPEMLPGPGVTYEPGENGPRLPFSR